MTCDMCNCLNNEIEKLRVDKKKLIERFKELRIEIREEMETSTGEEWIDRIFLSALKELEDNNGM